MDARIRGTITEYHFVVKALGLGWEIASPACHSAPYDFIIRRSPNQPWETVQVKTAYFGGRYKKEDRLEVGIRRNGRCKMRPYESGDFDLLFAYYDGQSWLIPWEEIKDAKSRVVVGFPRYDRWKI